MPIVKKIVSYVVSFFTFGTIVLFNDVIEKNRELELFVQNRSLKMPANSVDKAHHKRVQENGSYEKPNVFNEKLDKMKSMVAIPYISNNCNLNGCIQVTLAQKEFLKFLYKSAYDWLNNGFAVNTIENDVVGKSKNYRHFLRRFLILFSSLVQENSNGKMLQENGQKFRKAYGACIDDKSFHLAQGCAFEFTRGVYHFILLPLNDKGYCKRTLDNISMYYPTRSNVCVWQRQQLSESESSVYERLDAETVLFEGQRGLFLMPVPQQVSCVQKIEENRRIVDINNETQTYEHRISKYNTGDTLMVRIASRLGDNGFNNDKTSLFNDEYFSFDNDRPGTKIIRIQQQNDCYKYYRLIGLSIYSGSGDYGHYTYVEFRGKSVWYFDNMYAIATKIDYEKAKIKIREANGITFVYEKVESENIDSTLKETFDNWQRDQENRIQEQVRKADYTNRKKLETIIGYAPFYEKCDGEKINSSCELSFTEMMEDANNVRK